MSKFSSRNPILSSNIPHLSNLADLIILCYLTNNQVSFPCNIKLSTQVEHILPFATKGKALSFEKDKKCFNLLHLFLIPTKTLSHPFKLQSCQNKTSSQLFKINHLILCLDFSVLSWFPEMLKSNIYLHYPG